MNLSKYISTLIALFLFLGASAQTEISGTIYCSETERNIQGAHIYFQDCQRGTISDQNGEFTLSDWSENMILVVSHIAYQDTTILLDKDQTEVKVPLKRKRYSLQGVTVMGSAVPLLKDKPWFIVDYEISEIGILLLGYPKKKLRNPMFFLINKYGDVIFSQEADFKGSLCKDVAGHIRYKCTDSTWMVQMDTIGLALIDPIETELYTENIEKLKANVDDNFYLENYRYDDQLLEYYCYEMNDSNLTFFKEIINEEGIAMLDNRHIFERNEFEKRFADMCMFDPIYAPMGVKNEQVYLFNYVDNKLEIYNSQNEIQSSVTIDYHIDRNFYELLLYDETDKKFYAVFRKSGIFYLAEINTVQGEIERTVKIPQYEYIEKLRVDDGIAFFLYKKSMDDTYKRIFRMTI